jgi:hypothetical protein
LAVALVVAVCATTTAMIAMNATRATALISFF